MNGGSSHISFDVVFSLVDLTVEYVGCISAEE